MSIIDKNRKALWAQSGNCCSFPECRQPLVINANEADDQAVVGIECHIVGKKQLGPRGDTPLLDDNINSLGNLILLCGTHHTLIDAQPNTYTVQVLKEIKRTHEKWVNKAISEFVRLGTSIQLRHFITIDNYLDSHIQRYWPKRKDVEENKLYLHQKYIETIQDMIDKNKHALLTGVSGSGKSALAISFGILWQNNTMTEIGYPKPTGFYLEASSVSNTIERGEDLYRQIHAHTFGNALFIIDNCHLAPVAVNAFIRQWESNPQERSIIILVTRLRIQKSSWEEEPDDYFEFFKRSGTILEVNPKETYEGVLRSYSTAYTCINKARFVPIESDLSDSDHAIRLRDSCAHNLAMAHSLLETWYKVGGRLSDVTEESILDCLNDRYLTENKDSALASLCCLAQFEIPAHESFVQHLSRDQIKTLKREQLLTVEYSQIYGRYNRVDLHPYVASQLFKAYIRRNRCNYTYIDHIDSEIITYLKDYLMVCPATFFNVHLQLHRNNAAVILRQLLSDIELRNMISSQFIYHTPYEVAFYLFGLKKYGHEAAAKIYLGDYLGREEETEYREQLLDQIYKLNLKEIGLTLSFMTKIDASLISSIAGRLQPEKLSVKTKDYHCSYAEIQDIANSWKKMILDKAENRKWRRVFLENMDIQYLAQVAHRQNPMRIYFLLKEYLQSGAHDKGLELLLSIPNEVWKEKLNEVKGKITFSNLNSIMNQFIYFQDQRDQLMNYEINDSSSDSD